jgi:hypothetical protein
VIKKIGIWVEDEILHCCQRCRFAIGGWNDKCAQARYGMPLLTCFSTFFVSAYEFMVLLQFWGFTHHVGAILVVAPDWAATKPAPPYANIPRNPKEPNSS